MMVDVARTQDVMVGGATTAAVVLAGAILKKGRRRGRALSSKR